MSERSAFIEVINESPDDDTPRLVYADWLEERGETIRAEFIRLQVERAQLPFWDARQIPMSARENQLLGLYANDWRKELPQVDGVGWGDYRRGFVATASFPSFDSLKSHASRCWGATPLESVTVRDWPENPLDSFEPIPALRELSINQTVFHDRPLRQLADAPLLSTLRALNLNHCALGADGLREVLFTPYLQQLQALRLPFNSLGGPGIDVLLSTQSLKSLKELDLSEPDSYARYEEDPVVKAADLELFAICPLMSQLESLTLAGNEVGAAGLEALLQSSQSSNLKTLSVRANGLRADALRGFVDAPSHVRLETLDLGQNMIGRAGASLLGKAGCLSELKVLHLDRCEITAASQDLCDAPFMHHVRQLNLNENRIGPQDVRALLLAEPEHLHTLQLGFNDIGVKGVIELTQSTVSNQLQALDLSYNKLDDDSIKALILSPNLRGLRVLKLTPNSITRPAMGELTRSELGKQLVIFDGVDVDDPAIPFRNDE